MSAVPKRPKERGSQVGCKDQGKRIHLRFHHGSKGTDPDHFHGQRCKTCPKENPGNESRWRVGRECEFLFADPPGRREGYRDQFLRAAHGGAHRYKESSPRDEKVAESSNLQSIPKTQPLYQHKRG